MDFNNIVFGPSCARNVNTSPTPPPGSGSIASTACSIHQNVKKLSTRLTVRCLRQTCKCYPLESSGAIHGNDEDVENGSAFIPIVIFQPVRGHTRFWRSVQFHFHLAKKTQLCTTLYSTCKKHLHQSHIGQSIVFSQLMGRFKMLPNLS